MATPISPSHDDCVVLADGQAPGLSKDLVATKYNDAADPERPSLRFSGGSDVAATRDGIVQHRRVGDRREREPFPLPRRWTFCYPRSLLCWRRPVQNSPPTINAPALRIGSREPTSEPGCGESMNGNQAAYMTLLGRPLKRSWKLSHRLPKSLFRKHGGGARHPDPCSSRQRVVPCDQLQAMALGADCMRSSQGQTAEHVHRRQLHLQRKFPYDPGGYGGSQGDQDGDGGTTRNPQAGLDQDALLYTDQRNYAITHTTCSMRMANRSTAAKKACRSKLNKMPVWSFSMPCILINVVPSFCPWTSLTVWANSGCAAICSRVFQLHKYFSA